jgi:DNA-binding response OmpR family regulator
MAAAGRGACQPGAVRVLLVEDDPGIAEPLTTGLAREGFEVVAVATGRDALAAEPVDLVLLDLGLPDLDGQAVCRQLRERSAVPVIVVTARSDEIDRVTLLEIGADDYVVKPFGFRELVARMRAVLRRAGGPAPAAADPQLNQQVVLGGVVVDRRRHEVTVDAEPLALTPKEYDLLAFLAEDPGATRTRDEILRAVWDEHWWGSSKTLDVHMASLRRKLGEALVIETVRGVGFRLAVG